MNKELREDLEHLIICKDKSITPDLRDDIKMTLDYIDELEKENKILKELNVCVGCNINTDYKSRIDKAIDYIEDNKSYTTIEKFVGMNTFQKHDEDILDEEMIKELLDILRGTNE
jgi:hypothetical protein